MSPVKNLPFVAPELSSQCRQFKKYFMPLCVKIIALGIFRLTMDKRQYIWNDGHHFASIMEFLKPIVVHYYLMIEKGKLQRHIAILCFVSVFSWL